MQNLKRVQLSYHRVDGLSPKVAHGVYGGAIQNDLIEMEFFSESEDLTGTSTVSYDEMGNPVVDEDTVDEYMRPRKIVRTIHSRIVVSKATARNIVSWMHDVLDNMDEIDKEEDEDLFEGVDKGIIFSKTKQ